LGEFFGFPRGGGFTTRSIKGGAGPGGVGFLVGTTPLANPVIFLWGGPGGTVRKGNPVLLGFVMFFGKRGEGGRDGLCKGGGPTPGPVFFFLSATKGAGRGRSWGGGDRGAACWFFYYSRGPKPRQGKPPRQFLGGEPPRANSRFDPPGPGIVSKGPHRPAAFEPKYRNKHPPRTHPPGPP